MPGEDVSRWARARRAVWFGLQPEHQELLGWVGFTAPDQPALPAVVPARSQADRFASGLAAAAAWAAAHGGTIVEVKRKDEQPMPDGSVFKLGLWVGNTRQRP